MKCFYHNDADGRCAGFWVFIAAMIHDSPNYGSQFIPMGYSKPFPLDTIRPGEQVYIVDYSISPDEMRTLLDITKDVTWIDHHITAIQKYEGFELPVRGVRVDGWAGCMLTYCYLHCMSSLGDGEVVQFDPSMAEGAPLVTKLIDDWDCWKLKMGDTTRQFITAFYAYDFEPESINWDALRYPNGAQKLIDQGRYMLLYRDGWAKDYMSLGFETEFEGHHCFAVNLGKCNSEFFKSLPAGKYDVLIPFAFDGEKYTISFYSTTVDVSQIAVKYGGGGHKGASGCTVKELPFKKIVRE